MSNLLSTLRENEEITLAENEERSTPNVIEKSADNFAHTLWAIVEEPITSKLKIGVAALFQHLPIFFINELEILINQSKLIPSQHEHHFMK
jgi:hypothetical protein